MSVGRQVRRLRTGAGLSQRSLAEAAGVAIAYLSRVENERLIPTLRTLGRLGKALGVDVPAFLEAKAPLEPPDRCPVSLSGRCILDEQWARRGRKRHGRESYGPAELEALRLCNLVLQKGTRDSTRTLVTLLKGLLALPPADRDNPLVQNPGIPVPSRLAGSGIAAPEKAQTRIRYA